MLRQPFGVVQPCIAAGVEQVVRFLEQTTFVEVQDLRWGEGAEFDKRPAQGDEGIHGVLQGLGFSDATFRRRAPVR